MIACGTPAKAHFSRVFQKDDCVMATKESIVASHFGKNATNEFVEIALLVPTSRVEALLDLSRRRQQSVAQILRSMIDRTLDASEQSQVATT
jgi:hypothetical protein